MQFTSSIYIPGNTPVHRADVRVKLLVLLAYSITLFLVETWCGLALCGFACVLLAVVGKVSLRRLAVLLAPIYVIMAFALLFNSFSFDVSSAAASSVRSGISSGIFENSAPVALLGSFGFVPAGFARGAFVVLRIILLVLASFVLTFTTSSNDLIDALNDFLRPLGKLRVPVHDIATSISIALRFIPVTAEELTRVRSAQMARGAHFDDGSLPQRLRTWASVLIPLFVGLFKRADNLALAMEARCYGAPGRKTTLNPHPFTARSAVVLLLSLAACVVVAVLW